MNKPNLETCTVQEACDYAVFKIVEQGERCLSNGGSCAYSDRHGSHCAVGWLLDTTHPNLMNYSGSVRGLIREHEELVPEVIKQNTSLFVILQMFHDVASQADRKEALVGLNDKGINTDAPQYKQWVEMGDD